MRVFKSSSNCPGASRAFRFCKEQLYYRGSSTSRRRLRKRELPELSELEQLAAQGKAHADLKATKSKVAILNLVLKDYARWLRETAGFVDQFIRDPAYETDTYIKLSEHLKHSFKHSVTPDEVSARIDEFATKSALVRELQEQIENF